MDPHMLYVHRQAYRASLFAERVLLTTTATKGTHGFSAAAPQHARGGLGTRGRQEGRWLLHHQRSRINLNR